MKTPNLAMDFKKLRKSKSLTLIQIANACDFSETTVHKVESGKSVRWESLHMMLTKGMGTYPGTTTYEAMHRLWMKHREEMADDAEPDKGRKILPEHEKTAITAFRKLLKGRSAIDTKLILAAARKKANDQVEARRK